MGLIKRLADNHKADSLANYFRRRRFRLFEELIADLPRPLRILDVGGEENFWLQMRFGDQSTQITMLNLHPQQTHSPNITAVVGNATEMSEFADREFDVVFSNSVIEHLFTWDNQILMAGEIRRVGRRYFVQTPNKHFLVEPHFYFPGFQYLPVDVRARLARRFALGYHDRARTEEEAMQMVREIRLLSASELKTLFPEATILRERVAGYTKSLIACTPSSRSPQPRRKSRWAYR